jgi:hypothetical protein
MFLKFPSPIAAHDDSTYGWVFHFILSQQLVGDCNDQKVSMHTNIVLKPIILLHNNNLLFAKIVMLILHDHQLFKELNFKRR